MHRHCLILTCVANVALITVPAKADETPPPTLSLALRETLDAWAVPAGVDPGTDVLNKLQLSATVAGDRWGLTGWSTHAQVFRTDGASLSVRLGDVQTADNIEAKPLTRLFEAWVQKTFGTGDRTLSLRGGLLDLNADFDSIATASLFLNSSHGIGADVARSGRNGPSIFPVSSLGFRAAWSTSKRWTLRLAAYDGAPGDPDHPRRFAAVRLGAGDGALLAAQIEEHLTDKERLAIGAWRYTTRVPSTTGGRPRFDQGTYAAIEGPLPGSDKLSAWLRIGVAQNQAQLIRGYAGTGIVRQGLLAGRSDDKFGLAIAHARLDATGLGSAAHHHTETSIETSYLVKLSETCAVQPDLQYIITPSGGAATRHALALGLRVVLTAGYPRKAKADDASDPTVPPDGPQPPDQPDDKGKGPSG